MSTSALSLFNGSSGSSAGIDVTSVVSQLLDAERGPEKIWQSQQTNLQSQASALKAINSYLSDLYNKVNALKDSFGTLSSKSVSSSQPGILTATAQNSAAAGTHTVTVDHVATTSSYYTDVVPSGGTFANGTFSIQVGTGAANPITIDSSNNTVQSLASYINGQTDTLGVSASVVNDARGSRLVLLSNTSGLPGDLTIGGNLTLASDGSTVGTTKISGKNAAFTLDGVPLTSTSNTVADVMSGVSFSLVSGSPATPIQITISPNTDGATSAVNAFVSSYNTLINAINSQFAVTPGTNAPPLEANGSLRGLQSDLLSNLTYSMTGNSGIDSLRSLGITMNNDGTLSVDSSQLAGVVQNNFSDLQNFFQSADTTNPGFGVNFGTNLLKMTDPTDGVLNIELTQNTATQKQLTQQISDFEDRLAMRQQQLILQYSKLDTALRQYSTIMSQIQGELGSLPKIGQ